MHGIGVDAQDVVELVRVALPALGQRADLLVDVADGLHHGDAFVTTEDLLRAVGAVVENDDDAVDLAGLGQQSVYRTGNVGFFVVRRHQGEDALGAGLHLGQLAAGEQAAQRLFGGDAHRTDLGHARIEQVGERTGIGNRAVDVVVLVEGAARRQQRGHFLGPNGSMRLGAWWIHGSCSVNPRGVGSRCGPRRPDLAACF